MKNKLLAQTEGNQKATRQVNNVRCRMLLPKSSSESEISVHCDSSDTDDLSCSDSSFILFIYFLFHLYIYPPDLQESDGDANT